MVTIKNASHPPTNSQVCSWSWEGTTGDSSTLSVPGFSMSDLRKKGETKKSGSLSSLISEHRFYFTDIWMVTCLSSAILSRRRNDRVNAAPTLMASHISMPHWWAGRALKGLSQRCPWDPQMLAGRTNGQVTKDSRQHRGQQTAVGNSGRGCRQLVTM